MIRFRGVDFSYHRDYPLFRGLDLEIRGGLTLVLGPNGSGKSTLLRLAAGIEMPDRGVVEIGGVGLWKDEVEARMSLAYVPEQPEMTPYATIEDVMHLVCRLRNQPIASADRVLEKIGLELLAKRSIRELSLGQKRRAVMGVAWIGSPQVLLLDEPLESLDREMRHEVLDWIDRRLSDGAAVVIATHDVELFAPKAGRTIMVGDIRG